MADAASRLMLASAAFCDIIFEETLNKSSAVDGGYFPPIHRFEKLEIHKVFLHFSNLDLTENLSPSTLADLIRASLSNTARYAIAELCGAALKVGEYMQTLRGKLFLSGMDENAASLARKWGLGLELTDFCEARKLEEPAAMEAARARCSGIGSLWLHAPFAELSPCAIDPRVREVVMLRFRQTVQAALALGIRRIVVHSGYIPLVYFPEWFTARSVEFWREFLQDAPDGLCLALENVMEPEPDMLVQIAAGVDDPRFGLCLDVGHANTRVSETPPLDWIAPMAPWLRHVHLHNNDGDWDLHDALGQGMIPMPDILAALAELSPAADYTIENQNCEPSLRWLCARGYLEEP